MGYTPSIPPIIGNWYLIKPLGSGYSGLYHLSPLIKHCRLIFLLRIYLGSIFSANNVHTGQVVALKVQRVDHECPTNKYERHLYPFLQGGKGMPTLWASGVQGMWDYMAIDLLGASLDNLYRSSGKDSMELGNVCAIAMQVVSSSLTQDPMHFHYSLSLRESRSRDYHSCMHEESYTATSNSGTASSDYHPTRRRYT
jgi:hypothetical protein